MIQRTGSLLLIITLLSGCVFDIPDPTEEEIAQAVIECPPLKGMIKNHFESQSELNTLSAIRFSILKKECSESSDYIKYKNQKVMDALEPKADNTDK